MRKSSLILVTPAFETYISTAAWTFLPMIYAIDSDVEYIG